SWVIQGPTPYTLCGCGYSATTYTLALTQNADGLTPANLPRYYSQYAATASTSSADSSSGSGSSSVDGWVSGHRAIVYGIASGIGVLLLGCLVAYCRRKRRRVPRVAPSMRYSVLPRAGVPEEYPMHPQQNQYEPTYHA